MDGFLARLLTRQVLKRTGKLRTAILTLLLGSLLLCGVVFLYLGDYYRADPAGVEPALACPAVSTREIDGGRLFDGPGDSTALIFYPGAKVEAMAYAPLMAKLAEGGIDCFLAEMPFNMAIFGSSTADYFLEAYPYDTWIAAGHSMGGLVISGCAASHMDKIGGLVLLGAYPNGELPEGLPLCSIYGSEDGCLNRSAYESGKAYWPADAEEFCIEGGNHAGFGCYGPQDGDGIAAISAEEQQEITADLICQFAGIR